MNHHSNSRNDEQDALLWTAFQYAADELPSADAHLFEERLATDQAAREALAEAVALSEAARIAEMPLTTVVAPAARERSFWQSPSVWFACGAAACLLLTFAMSRPASVVKPASSNDGQQELAFLWAEGQANDGTGQPDGEMFVAVDPTMDDQEFESLAAVEEPAAPEWLVAALAETRTPPKEN